MPCYEVRMMTVEFKAENRELLKKALDSLGWNITENEESIHTDRFTINLKTQKVTVESSNMYYVNELKKQYSLEAIKKVTSLKKWTLQTKGQNKYQAVRY